MPDGGSAMVTPIETRETVTADRDAIFDVHRQAFGGDQEATLVLDLLADPTAAPYLSLMAVRGGVAIGHALFTACRLANAERGIPAVILAPLAVVPAHQSAGIGRTLVEDGIARLRRTGVGLVFVLGDPEYYGRFGFKPALPHGLSPPFALVPGYEDGWRMASIDGNPPVAGRLVCADALMRPDLWAP